MKCIVQGLKILIKVATGKEFFEKPDVTCPKDRFGSDYGGWYIVPAGIDCHSIVYSFGIGEDASFDIGLIEKFNLIIHAFDPTPKSIEWVKREDYSTHFVLHEYGLSSFNGDVSFYPPENPNHISYTLLDRPTTKARAIIVPVKKLGTIMKELGHDHIDLLKMDIEGAEYDVIMDILESNIRPWQILVEFHHRFQGVGIKKSKEAINQLRLMGYKLFSVSATNEEFCFIRDSI